MVSIFALTPVAAHAEWRQNNTGWWYSSSLGSGYLQDRWYQENGKDYYFDSNGYMVTGWKEMPGSVWYYFYGDGSMAKNTYIGNYYMNNYGIWDKEKDTTTSVGTSTTNASQGISVVYPSSWTKVTKDQMGGIDVIEGYLLDEQGTSVNLVSESMQGYSKETYAEASRQNVENYLSSGSVTLSDSIINNKSVSVFDYNIETSGITAQLHQVTFYNNGKAYIFTLCEKDSISYKTMSEFNNMLNTVTFK